MSNRAENKGLTLSNFILSNISNNNLFNRDFIEDKNRVLSVIFSKDKEALIGDPESFLSEFRNQLTKKDVLNNFKIAQDRQKSRQLISSPVSGDIFIDDIGREYRLVNITKDDFQLCYDGSFYMSVDGHASMSGSFAFDAIYKGKEISNITAEELKNTGKQNNRSFWFFMDNSMGGNRGLHFNCEVKTFKSK